MSLLDTFKLRIEQRELPVDPATFNDPLALRTEWRPLVPGGTNFATHRLVEVDSTRLELRKSLGSFAFGGAFLVSAFSIITFAGLMSARGDVWDAVVALLFAVPFSAIGGWIAWPSSLDFDASTRQVVLRAESVPFSAIHALQLIPEYVSSDGDSFWSYELNLVLTSGHRRNLVDHGNLPRLRADARRLRELLGCRLWDAAPVSTR